jgi:hypothetical protein
MVKNLPNRRKINHLHRIDFFNPKTLPFNHIRDFSPAHRLHQVKNQRLTPPLFHSSNDNAAIQGRLSGLPVPKLSSFAAHLRVFARNSLPLTPRACF